MSEAPLIFLGKNASLNYQKWWIQLLEKMSTSCNLFLGPRGLLEINYHLTDAQFALLAPTMDVDGAPVVPNVRPSYSILALNGTAANIATNKQANVKAEAITTAMGNIRSFAIQTAGCDVTDEVSNPATGLTEVTFHQLLAHIQTIYGVLKPADVAAIRASLLTWDSAKTVQTNLLQFQQAHLVLANAGYPVNEDIKISNLAEATRTNTAIQEVFKLYRTEQPLMALQTFAALKAKIVLLEPGFTASNAGYAAANAAAAATATASLKADLALAVKEALATQAKEFQKQIVSLQSQLKASTHGNNRSKPKGIRDGRCGECRKLDNSSETLWVACKKHNSKAP